MILILCYGAIMEIQKLKLKNHPFFGDQTFYFSKRYENNENFVNLYPENISISSIVGRNGSGKSKLIKELLYFSTGIISSNINELYTFDKEYNSYDNYISSDDTFGDRYDIIYDTFTTRYEQKNVYETLIDKLGVYYGFDEEILIDNACIIEFVNNGSSFLKTLVPYPSHIKFVLKEKFTNERLEAFYDNISTISGYYEDPNDNELALKEFYDEFLYKINKSIEEKDLKTYLLHMNFLVETSSKYNSYEQHISELYKSYVFDVSSPINDKEIKNLVDFLDNNVESDGNGFTVSIKSLSSNNRFLKYFSGEYFKRILFIKKNNLNSNIFLDDLSSGEIAILSLFSRLFVYLTKIAPKKEKYSNYLIILDEPETFLHPELQRNLIDLIVKFLSQSRFGNYFFNVILTTHSPFIITDIQLDNIIFLEKDKDLKPKQIKLQKTNTFSSNIHTLLYDSFFMDDGTMGKYALATITKLVDDLKEDTNLIDDFRKKEMLNTIMIIGEEFLRKKLLETYKNKFANTKEERLKIINKKIDLLNKEKKELL